MMIFASMVSLKLIDVFWVKEPLKIQVFAIALAICVLLSLYYPINAYLTVNYRGNKYKTNEALVCYWNFWVDWFSFFWIDMFLNLKFMKKKLKKRQKQKRREEREKKKQE